MQIVCRISYVAANTPFVSPDTAVRNFEVRVRFFPFGCSHPNLRVFFPEALGIEADRLVFFETYAGIEVSHKSFSLTIRANDGSTLLATRAEYMHQAFQSLIDLVHYWKLVRYRKST
jgi:hypothetical protein